MADWVCGSLGGSLIPRLHLTTLLRRLWLQTNLYCADSGSKWRHLLKMAAAILRRIRFTFLEAETRRPSFLQSMVHIKRSVIADKAIGLKDQFLTDAVWNIIKNKVHAHFPNVGIRRKAIQRLCFSTTWHWTASSCFQSHLYRLISALTCICLSRYLHYMHKLVGGAKQAVM